MKKEIRTALIGTGSMGKKYAKMLADGEVVGMKLSAMVCKSESSFEWGKTFADAKIYRSVEELYSNGNDFDAVIIATPHKTHPELALGAFEIGKHVMCDKPAGIYAKDAVRMYKAAEEKKLVYGLMFHQRLRSDYIKVKEMIKKGEFGAIHRIMMVCTRYFRTNAYHKSSPWRSSIEGEGGGALINQGQHILDMWQWLFGLPKEIQALIMTGKYNDFDVEDEASIFMRYENNTTGSFIISTAEGMSEDRLVISGSKKSAVLSDGILKVIEFS
ncbi:MAG: Gfo/Idh/MocA family oxidoreductase, partial [Firmicutes bacterium]|nr:Gfo/Idh/MocA family oxidoreductase [Bacillota bacterium]